MMRERAIQCLDHGILWQLPDGTTTVRPYAGRDNNTGPKKPGRVAGMGVVGNRLLSVLAKHGPATARMLAERTSDSAKRVDGALSYLMRGGQTERNPPADYGIHEPCARWAYQITAAGRRQLGQARRRAAR